MDAWDQGDSYELFMGRWSASVAEAFLVWVDGAVDGRWLDVGCGTGALSAAIAKTSRPSRVTGIDPSDRYVVSARNRLGGDADLLVADAQSLPFPAHEFDVTVSGLCLNFIPDPAAAAAEMQRVTRDGGIVAAYVWDYAEGMEMLRRFWDVATDLDSVSRHLDEGTRFPLCRPGPLAALFTGAGFDAVETTSVTISTRFSSFEDYWRPFLGGQGPASTYVRSLDEQARRRLAFALERLLLPESRDGVIDLRARAWAVKGVAAAWRSPATPWTRAD